MCRFVDKCKRLIGYAKGKKRECRYFEPSMKPKTKIPIRRLRRVEKVKTVTPKIVETTQVSGYSGDAQAIPQPKEVKKTLWSRLTGKAK